MMIRDQSHHFFQSLSGTCIITLSLKYTLLVGFINPSDILQKQIIETENRLTKMKVQYRKENDLHWERNWM